MLNAVQRAEPMQRAAGADVLKAFGPEIHAAEHGLQPAGRLPGISRDSTDRTRSVRRTRGPRETDFSLGLFMQAGTTEDYGAERAYTDPRNAFSLC